MHREKLRSALRASAHILSSDVLASFNSKETKEKEDEEAIELVSQAKFKQRAISMRKTLDQASVAKSRSSTFSELVLRNTTRNNRGATTRGVAANNQSHNPVSYSKKIYCLDSMLSIVIRERS